MRSTPRHPSPVMREPSPPLWPWGACVFTGCAATAAAESLGVTPVFGAVLGCAVSATTVGIPLGLTAVRVRRYWQERWDRGRKQNEELAEAARLAERAMHRLAEASQHLVEERLRVLLDDPHARRGDVPPAPADPCPAEPWAGTVAAAHDALLDAVFATLELERGLRENTLYAFLALAERVRTQAQTGVDAARALTRRATDSSLLETLMRDEHAWARVGRTAQGLEVLCGRRPGRSWDRPILLSEVVGAAQSRILDYRRVRVVGGEDMAAHGLYAEALIHAIAELLDNAAWFSPPTSTVWVRVERGHDGASVVIEDAGRGMDPQTLERAHREVSRADADVSTLGGDPRFGLAVVGALAARTGFRVRFSAPGDHGGIRTVVWVPGRLLTPPGVPSATHPTRPVATDPHARPEVPVPAIGEKTAPPVVASAVLPQRRQRRQAEPSEEAPTHRSASSTTSKPASLTEAVPDLAAHELGARVRALVEGAPIAPGTACPTRPDSEGPTP
ncbi:ATP-binding protein [Embleya sp. MST-111070]|uniref:ATP-binding protein n=1 Tax=Embleya sp. MST-111070 TaxID=3398231 RepID=UPI003F73EC20